MDNSDSIVETTKLSFEVFGIVKQRMRKAFENEELTLPQSRVLGVLVKFGKIKISELSEKVNLSNSTVSGILDRLEKQGLVQRVRSEEDRRTVYIQITDKFKEVHKGGCKKAEESFGDLLSVATPEQIEKINDGLNALKNILLIEQSNKDKG
ncbi:MarR family winged helix-turn-helix transcriptional regulator [Acetivibrio cellulolyticus]|uniref:MarR family winged helix-turn-helix transcriptional regulator n=1 Tax=Acetivibrio cellulolyticus TaxID=35830 RepID=UPI0001E2D4A6|nr:MarR family transcriptional regulator [Acetivibrio cellulolyticus]